ncbi:hypothetical protein WA171_006193 [Blastocystis sp. BT1]
MKMTNSTNIHLIIQDTFIFLLRHRWTTLSDGEKSLIQETEIAFYVNQFNVLSRSIMKLTAKTIAWIAVMENERYLQSILDYIAAGLQNTSDCSPQLLLLLVLLEEVYEAENAIPLLTEKKATIQSVISGSVAGITSSVSSILRSVSDEDIVSCALQILLILIPHNDLSCVLDPSMTEALFKLICDFSNPLSMESMKCVNELLMKRLIPYSYRDTYSLIINTITTLISTLSQHIEEVSVMYVKRMNLMIYELVVNYLSVIIANQQFNFDSFLASLVTYTQAQVEPRCYLQLLQIWNELAEFLLQMNWNNGITGHLPSLVQYVTQALLISNHCRVIVTANTTDEFLEEDSDILLSTVTISSQELIDEITGDYEEIPRVVEEPQTEYDYIVQKSLLLLSQLLHIPTISETSLDALYSLAISSFESVMTILSKGEEGDIMRDYSVVMRLVSCLNFGERNINILVLLSRIINECYVNNVYIYGRKVTQFYIDSLLCFKQYIFVLNNQLGGADIEGILTSLYMTLTNSVTVPPNLLLITISNVMIYIASNCTIANVTNLSFIPGLVTNFTKETSQCPLIIQRQLLIFLIYLLTHSLSPQEYSNALSTLLAPIYSTLLTAQSPTVAQSQSRRFFQRSSSVVGGASVVMNSTYTRCAYLLTSALQESSMMMKVVKDIIYPQLLPVFIQIAQILIDSSQKNENSHNYENCRILWNCELYAASILRSVRATMDQFLPVVGSLLHQLPNTLSQIRNTSKSFIYELLSIKALRLINLMCMERSLPREFLQNIVLLMTQIGEQAICSISTDVILMFVKCCSTLFSMHSVSLTTTPEIMNYILTLSQFLYQLLASESVSQELLSAVLDIYKNTGMLPIYKAPAFRANLRQSLSLVLLQHVLSEVHSTLSSDMIATLYTVNFSDFSPFFETDIPLFLNSLNGLSKENKEKLAWNITTVTDMPSFQLLIQRLMKDIRIYSSCN